VRVHIKIGRKKLNDSYIEEGDQLLYDQVRKKLEEKSDLIKKIWEENELRQQFINSWNERHSSGWQIVNKQKDFSVYYSTLPNGILRFLIEGHVKCGVFPVAVLANEVDLYTQWIPLVLGYFGLKKSINMSDESDGRMKKKIQLLGQLPFPLTNRDVTIQAALYDTLEKNDFCITTRDISDILPKHPDYVRVKIISGGFYGNIDNGDLSGGAYFIFDPIMRSIPNFLVNLGINIFAPSLFQYVVTKLQTLENTPEQTEFWERIKKDREGFYAQMKNRLKSLGLYEDKI